ncbi:MAG TPA: protease HtpX [Polyangiaceae bacterium]|nr:protease HtpX [Polyangiaceae bacterium]
MFKRIALLVVTNLAVVFLLNIVLQVVMATGLIDPKLLGNYGPLLLMATVFGFGGSFISLLISKWMAKMSTGAQVIEAPRNSSEAWLLETVRRQAERVGIEMPEVAIYEADEPNAFATGPTKNSALVAVSTGLLNRMDRSEVEAVLGHEVSHVANGDMVTLTLIQGVLNTFVIFFSRIIGSFIDSALRGRDDDRRSGTGMGYFVAVMVSQVVLGLLASVIVAWFSRWREYRADAGGANLAGRNNMVDALRRLGAASDTELPKSMAAFGIRSGLGGLLASHPPIEERIRRLQESPVAS